MTNSSKTLQNEKDQDWVLIQSELFQYPLSEGQHPTLLANSCKICGRSFFPKRALCPYCFDQGEMENVTLSRRGIIYASTVVRIPSPTGIEAPYAYGYVDIPVNNIRVFALFTGDDPTSFIPNREVELVVEPIRTNHEGQQIIGYKFKPLS